LSPGLAPPPSILRGIFLVSVLTGWGSGIAGCEMFRPANDLPTTTARKIPHLRPPTGSIQLEAMYVERPVGEPLLGDELWRHVDQLASIDAQTRRRIRENGFRVGVVGANPPVALQKMLGLKSDFVSDPDAESAKQLVGQRFFPISGGEVDIQVSRPYRECTLETASGHEGEPRHFENAVCKYRVRAVRIQDGWVGLQFLPQISHGDDHLRHAVGDAGWRFQNGQQTESFFLERFDLKLSVGDMAVITCDDDDAGKLGHLFFCGPSALQPSRETAVGAFDAEAPPPSQNGACAIQRLLIVRLAGMDESEPGPARGR
jgi:hypothetical protein